MAIVSLHDLLHHASENGYAVAAFPATDLSVLRALVDAAEEARAPLVLLLDGGAHESVRTPLAAAATQAAADAQVPVAVQLTGVRHLETALIGLRLGCNALSLCGTPDDFPGNVALAVRMRELLSETGIALEGTLGSDAAPDRAEWLTLPSEAKEYARRTGVDALHVGVGIRDKSGRPDLGRLGRLRDATHVPLTATVRADLNEEDFHRLIARGVSKLDCSAVLGGALNRALSDPEGVADIAALQTLLHRSTFEQAVALHRDVHAAGRAAEIMMQCDRELPALQVFTFETLPEQAARAEQVLREQQSALYTVPGLQQVLIGRSDLPNGGPRFAVILRFASAQAMRRASDHPACRDLNNAVLHAVGTESPHSEFSAIGTPTPASAPGSRRTQRLAGF